MKKNFAYIIFFLSTLLISLFVILFTKEYITKRHFQVIVVLFNAFIISGIITDVLIKKRIKTIVERVDTIDLNLIKHYNIGFGQDKKVNNMIYGYSIPVLFLSIVSISNNVMINGHIIVSLIGALLAFLYTYYAILIVLLNEKNNNISSLITDAGLKSAMDSNSITYRSFISIGLLIFVVYSSIIYIFSLLVIEDMLSQEYFLLFIALFTMTCISFVIMVYMYNKRKKTA